MPGIFQSGLNVRVATPPPEPFLDRPTITDEAAVTAREAEDLRVDLAVAPGDLVEQGAPLMHLRRAAEVALTAPMPARVASVDLGPGRRLSQVVLFHEPAGGRRRHDVGGADRDETSLRRVVQGAGLWMALRSRPFGRVPPPGERPAAIFVMAVDTRPLAPEPRMALAGAEEDLLRGLDALQRLTDGPVYFCQDRDSALVAARGRVRLLRVGALHPHGLAGFQIHALCPANAERPVWDLHAEDAAALGALLRTGLVPETRLVSVAGPALREARLVRCQPGADLRGLTRALVRPGPHALLSGSALEGREAHWLGRRDRQVTALPRQERPTRDHWFRAALSRASRPLPVIPTAALDQALGGALPTAAFLRALGAGDAEGATRLGMLSLLEEDLALADYVTGATPPLSAQLRVLLDRVEAEVAG